MPEVLSPFQGVAVQPGQDPTGEDRGWLQPHREGSVFQLVSPAPASDPAGQRELKAIVARAGKRPRNAL
jgi:hypothetical protein